jgi:hypothetical protein
MVDASEWNSLFGSGGDANFRPREFGTCCSCGKENAVLVDGVCGECYVKFKEAPV